MQQILKKQEFMDMYGDPLTGYHLEDPINLLEPSYFVLRRVLFALVSILLWKQPYFVLASRIVIDILTFSRVAIVWPHEG